MSAIAKGVPVGHGEPGHGDEIHLFADATRGEGDATIAIRWCICPTILKQIKEKAGPKPSLLLVITRGHTEIERGVVPLEQEMEYFYFRSPGEHKIQATILCWNRKRINSLFRKNGGTYETDLIYENGDLRKRLTYDDRPDFEIGKGEVVVNVAAEFFAKKPSHFIWNWANLWFETQPKDQCQFRRRCMLAFSLQPIVVALWIMIICPIRLVLALFLGGALGLRNTDFKPVIHPFGMATNYIWGDIDDFYEDSFFTTNKKGQKKPALFALCAPVVLLGLTGILSVVNCFISRSVPFWMVPLIAAGIIIEFVVVIIILKKVIELVINTSGSPEQRQHKKNFKAWLKERLREEALAREYEETYGSMVCQGVPVKVDLKELPFKRRTIYLRFMNTKTKVCRPFPK